MSNKQMLPCLVLLFHLLWICIIHFRETIKRGIKKESMFVQAITQHNIYPKGLKHWSLEKLSLQNGHSYRMNFDNCNCLANRSSQPWTHMLTWYWFTYWCFAISYTAKIDASGSTQRSIFASDNVSASDKKQSTGGTALCGLYWCLNYWTVQGMWRKCENVCTYIVAIPDKAPVSSLKYIFEYRVRWVSFHFVISLEHMQSSSKHTYITSSILKHMFCYVACDNFI